MSAVGWVVVIPLDGGKIKQISPRAFALKEAAEMFAKLARQTNPMEYAEAYVTSESSYKESKRK